MRTTLAAPVASACALPGRRPAPWLEHPGVKPGGERHYCPQQRVGATFVTAWSHAHSTHNTDRHTQPMNTHHNSTHRTSHTHTHTHATDRRAEGIGRRSECGRHFPGVAGVSGVSEVRSQTLIRHQAPIITFISHPSPAHIKQLHIVVPPMHRPTVQSEASPAFNHLATPAEISACAGHMRVLGACMHSKPYERP